MKKRNTRNLIANAKKAAEAARHARQAIAEAMAELEGQSEAMAFAAHREGQRRPYAFLRTAQIIPFPTSRRFRCLG